MKNIKKLLFKDWLVEDLQYGRFGGRSLNNAPREYLQWMLKQIDTGSTFSGMVTDNGRNVPVERIKKEIENILGIRPQPQQAQPRQAQPQQPQPRQAATAGRVGVTNWLYGKTKIARPDLGIPVADLDIAAKKTDENNFTFVILDLQERKLVSKGTIPKDEIQDVLKSVKTPQNEVITANKPSDFFDILNPKTVATGKGNIIPEGRITEEQKAIDAKFEQILKTPEQNHIMINALAGSGKTTMLKHLAWKYGKGKKWLYLVFNAKNKEEAQGEFPSSVQIETTNGWAGREVLEKNNIKQTDRIQKYSFSDKAKMVADSQSFERYMDSLGMPSQNKVYGTNINSMSGTEKAMYFLLRKINNEFKSEAVKLLGLVKAFAVDPRKSDLQEKIKEVLDKYDINTNLESSKDYIEKNMPWAKDKLEDIYNQDFMNSDFTKELIQATNWLLQQSLPHETEEEIEAEKAQFKGQKVKLGHVRDFDDDLWYSAIHADELVWPKYEVVLADEVQDFNVAQRIILQKLAEQGAKIVAVGDPNQSIYRFRGADSNAFSQLKQTLQDASKNKDVEQQLTANFRSRQAIIDLANREGEEAGHVSNLKKGREFASGPGKLGEGKATTYELNYDDAFNNLKDEKTKMGELMRQTAFISRTNEPLVHASLRLMKEGVPFVILGKDLVEDITKHIDKIINLFKLTKDTDVDVLQEKLETYQEEQIEKFGDKTAKAGVLKELKETTDAMLSALEQFIQENEQGSIYQFKQWLASKFGGIDIEKAEGKKELDKKIKELNPVILTTVHKSKGLQFSRVYILRDDLWPHPRAKRQEDLEQEMNNKYIGRTRAEDELHILDLKGQPGYKDEQE